MQPLLANAMPFCHFGPQEEHKPILNAVGCRTAECCRRHQTAAARVAALTQDPRDEDEADEEADALAGAIPAGAAAAAAPGVRPLPYFGGSPRGSPVGSDGSRDLSPEPMGMLGLCKRDYGVF